MAQMVRIRVRGSSSGMSHLRVRIRSSAQPSTLNWAKRGFHCGLASLDFLAHGHGKSLNTLYSRREQVKRMSLGTMIGLYLGLAPIGGLALPITIVYRRGLPRTSSFSSSTLFDSTRPFPSRFTIDYPDNTVGLTLGRSRIGYVAGLSFHPPLTASITLYATHAHI